MAGYDTVFVSFGMSLNLVLLFEIEKGSLPRWRGVVENHAAAPARLDERNRHQVGAAFPKLKNEEIL